MKRKTTLCVTAALLASLFMGCAIKRTPLPPASAAIPEATGNTPATEPAAETAPVLEATMETTPATESTVSAMPTPEPDAEDLVRILDFLPDIEIDLRYATTDNFTGQVIYDFEDAYLRYGTLKKLMAASEILSEKGYGIKIWDAFRPVSAQAALYEVHPDPNVVSHPVNGYRAHCRGNAVDMTLVDLSTGQELPMPTGFDNFTALADRDYSDCDAIPAANAQLLEQIMTECGFKPLQSEWWHFTDTDTYPVEEFFDPAKHTEARSGPNAEENNP